MKPKSPREAERGHLKEAYIARISVNHRAYGEARLTAPACTCYETDCSFDHRVGVVGWV
jgi:hypothetical protein